jgi:Rieske Fe-S protein
MNDDSTHSPCGCGEDHSQPAATETPASNRRDFLASVLVAGTAVPVAAGAVAMGLRYVLPPTKMATADLLMCRADEVRPGEFRIFDNVLGNRICLLRDSDVPPPDADAKTYSPFKAFSLRCSHLGCFAHWEGGVRKFVCPCHNAVFNEDGQVVAGPPPVGLTRIAVEVRDGALYMKIPYAKA